MAVIETLKKKEEEPTPIQEVGESSGTAGEENNTEEGEEPQMVVSEDEPPTKKMKLDTESATAADTTTIRQRRPAQIYNRLVHGLKGSFDSTAATRTTATRRQPRWRKGSNEDSTKYTSEEEGEKAAATIVGLSFFFDGDGGRREHAIAYPTKRENGTDLGLRK
ncbi:unnamed protein product [Microthlaspi erraticum]|uniref:Uncharacterized protein n=1 Tax=Microthlaspi erraticum TaxID=1685480 RepID=A0A6D2KSQ5_9BRAS|nr:unnamed protein product [Microthlaspi erraticum]